MASIKEYVDYWHRRKQINPPARFLLPFMQEIQTLDLSSVGKDAECTPEFWTHVMKFADRAAYIQSELANLAGFIPIKYLATREQSVQDLATIKKEVENFDINGADYIYFVREIITYYPERDVDFSFGKFDFKLMQSGVVVEPHSGNTARNQEFHPYVKRNKLCLGQFEKGYKLAFNEMRFYDAYTIVMDLMTRYGGDDLNGTPAGPHNPFNLWIGFECEVCGSSADLEDMTPCAKTKLNICKKCISSSKCVDENTGETYLPSYISQCETCGKYASGVKGTKCAVCRRNNS